MEHNQPIGDNQPQIVVGELGEREVFFPTLAEGDDTCPKHVLKQKTAYEIMSGDWSSDVCSSDLQTGLVAVVVGELGEREVFFPTLAEGDNTSPKHILKNLFTLSV